MLEKNLTIRSRWADMLDRELLPGLEPYLRRLRSPLGCLAASAMAAAACGLALHPRGFVALAGILAVIGLGALWPWLDLLGLRGRLTFESGRGREGEPVDFRVSLRNRSPLCAWGLAVVGPDGGGPAAAGLAAPGWRTTETSWRFVPECRGEYPQAGARLATSFPFGIREASRALDVPSRIVVWPRTYPVVPVPTTAGRADTGHALRDRPDHSGDIIGIRPYRRGDSLRRVHWPQTARVGELVVCEEQAQGTPRVQLVLDTHRGSHAGEGPGGSLEWAIRVAASFAEGWIALGAEIELIAGGKDLTPRGRPGRARLARMLDALARLDPEGALPLAEVLPLPCCRPTRGGVRVVIATDLGVRPLGERARGGGTCDRFVVLRSAAFADGAWAGWPEAAPASFPAWIWIDGPDRVARALRGAYEEVTRDG